MKVHNVFTKCIFLLLFIKFHNASSSKNFQIDVNPHQDDLRQKLNVDLLDSDIVTPIRLREDLQSVALSHFRSRRSISEDSSESSDDEFQTPTYKINAFGEEMVLRLRPDDNLVAPAYTTTYSWKNQTLTGSALRKCFYKGLVVGQPTSQVAVSICDGMTGSIYTDDHIYFIAPVQKNAKDSQVRESSIYHSVQRRSISNRSKRSINTHGSSCGVKDARHWRRYLLTYKPNPIEDIANKVANLSTDYFRIFTVKLVS